MSSEGSALAEAETGAAEAPAQTHRIRHIPELDGIRGLAAMAVIFHHICYASLKLEEQSGWPASIRALYHVTQFGNSGVDLFFVLSGFLISSILLQDRRSSRYYQDFYWKRALRIAPLYVLCLLLMLLFEHQVSYVAMAAVFLVNFASVFHIEGLGPFWTLAIEEQFYLLWPTVVRRKTVTQVRRWAIAMIAIAVVLRFAFALKGHHNYYLTFLRWDTLAAGALLACHFHEAGSDERKRHSVDRLLAGCALGSLPIFGLMHLLHTEAMRQAWMQSGITLLSAAMIGLAISHSGAKIWAPFRSATMTFFGLISYALYMVHTFFIQLYDGIRGPLSAGDVRGYWVRLVVVLAAAVGASLVSRYVVELPAMRLRKYVLKHPNLRAEHERPPLPLAPM